MNSNQLGTLSELAVAAEAAKRGYRVSMPIGDGAYDMILDKDGKLFRIQVKGREPRKGAIAVLFKDPTSTNKAMVYNSTNVDALIVHDRISNRMFWLPATLADTSNSIALRLERSANNQTKGVHLASDYEVW